jgi:hypothetical protein
LKNCDTLWLKKEFFERMLKDQIDLIMKRKDSKSVEEQIRGLLEGLGT